jgi:hypothetical protein
MDEDQILQSIIADPQLTDPSIDTSGLRTTTPTRTELLANVPEFSGLKFDPTQRSYIEDLYSVYGGGLPTIPEPVVEDTAQIPGAVDTLVDVGEGGGGSGATLHGFDVDSPKNTQDFGQNLVDQGIGVQATPTDPVVAPGEMPLTQDDFDAFNEIAVTPNLDDIDLGNPLNDPRVVSEEQGLVGGIPDRNRGMIGQTTNVVDDIDLGNPTGDPRVVSEEFGLVGTPSYIDPIMDPNLMSIRQQQTLEAQDLDAQGNLLQSGIDKIKSVIPDFDPIKVGARLAFNTIVGKPVSLVFDLLQATGLEGGRGTFANELGDEYGMDDIGRLTSGPMAGYAPNSMFGDIVESARERIDNIQNRSAPQTEASIKKIEELNDFIQKATSIKTKQTAPQEDIGSVPEDITTGVDPVTGDLPGGGNIVDEFAPSDIQATDPSLDIPDRGRGDDGSQDTTDTDPADDFEVSGDIADVGTAMDLIGPTPTPQQIPDRNRGDGGGSGAVSDAQAAANQDAARGGQYGGSGNGGSSGGGKIVCTMMNESYGFGSFRNKIWLRHSKDLAPEYQKGYHKIFLPLVKLSKNNKVLKTMLEHIAVHRTIDIRQESRGKVHLLGRVYRKILEPICYWVGKHAKR